MTADWHDFLKLVIAPVSRGRNLMIIVIAAITCLCKVVAMNAKTDPTAQPEDQRESTYALLTRSEEKKRNALEMAIYSLLIINGMIAICQFAQQSIG